MTIFPLWRMRSASWAEAAAGAIVAAAISERSSHFWMAHLDHDAFSRPERLFWGNTHARPAIFSPDQRSATTRVGLTFGSRPSTVEAVAWAYEAVVLGRLDAEAYIEDESDGFLRR